MLDNFRFFPKTRELTFASNGSPSISGIFSLNSVIDQARWMLTSSVPLVEIHEADEVLHEREICKLGRLSMTHPLLATHEEAPWQPKSDNDTSKTVGNIWGQAPLNETLSRPEQPGICVNPVSFSSLLKQSGDANNLVALKDVHAQIVKCGHEKNRFLANLLVQMYGNCGWLEDARAVFGKIYQRNVYSFNLMIGACCDNGQENEAFYLFQQVQIESTLPDKVTFLSTISACASQSNLAQGEQMHASIAGSALDSDVAVGNALVNMYGKCGSLKHAQRMFDDLDQQDVFSWSALIAAYAQHGQAKEAFQLFQQMQLEGVIPNKVTFLSILSACGNLTALDKGQQMYACLTVTGFDAGVTMGTTLVNMYGKCGYFKGAQSVFCSMSERTVVTWNAMISAHTEYGSGKGAYRLFQHMQLEGMIPDKATYVSILSVCADQALLAEGKQIHAHIVGCGFERDVVVGSALVNLYGKCGKVEVAERVFNKMIRRSVVSWNSMAAAYAQHGQGKDALQLHPQMLLEGINPNEATFSSLLSACDHAGLVDEGCHCFVSMGREHGIIPGLEHYDCVIDLLGRAGQLAEGENLINSMPLQPSASSWITLLGACKVHLDLERGQRAAKRGGSLIPGNPTPYVLLSNIYAAAKNLEDAEKV